MQGHWDADGAALPAAIVALLGAEPRTPLNKALRTTLCAMGALDLTWSKPSLLGLLPA